MSKWVSLYAAEAILLGFQHYLVMIGTVVIIATIIVPLMGGGNVRIALEFPTRLFLIHFPIFSTDQITHSIIAIGGES